MNSIYDRRRRRVLTEQGIEDIALETLEYLEIALPRRALILMNRLSSMAEWDVTGELASFYEIAGNLIATETDMKEKQRLTEIVYSLKRDQASLLHSSFTFSAIVKKAFEELVPVIA